MGVKGGGTEAVSWYQEGAEKISFWNWATFAQNFRHLKLAFKNTEVGF